MSGIMCPAPLSLRGLVVVVLVGGLAGPIAEAIAAGEPADKDDDDEAAEA